MTVNVAATVTPITKQEKLIIVTLPADEACLDQSCEEGDGILTPFPKEDPTPHSPSQLSLFPGFFRLLPLC